MSYPAYAETKPSSLEWLGDIPQDWELVRLKFLKSGAFVYGANEAAEVDDPNLPRFIRITDLRDDGTLRDDTFRSLPKDIAAPYMLEDGDFLFARSGATVGKAFVYCTKWGPACFAGYLIRLKPNRRKVLSEFLKYYVQSNGYENSVQEVTIKATIQNVSAEKYANFLTVIPPIPEQQQIAAFLDRKTAELDAVLRLKERQLKLLGEKRQALISQAVTRGLDPTAPLKSSGIPWLGDVPEHWEVNRLKYVSQIISGQSPHESTYNTNGIGVVLINGPAEYSEADFGLTVEAKWTTDPIRWAPKGCLLFCLRGSTTGRLNITHAEVSIGRGVAAIVAHEDQAFINYLMVTLRAAVVGTSNGSTFPSVTSETLGNYYLALPSFPEQKAIVAYLDRETARMDGTAQAIRTQIGKVREYRQALISSAVTGEIDVRGM